MFRGLGGGNMAVGATLFFGFSLVVYTIYAQVDQLVKKDKRNENNHAAADVEFLRLQSTSGSSNGAQGTRKILAVTRVHKGSATQMSSKENVLEFVKNSAAYASSVLVCLGNPNAPELDKYMQEVRTLLQREGLSDKTQLLPVSPWGRFTTALNAAVVKAVDGGYDVIAFQSLEFRVNPDAVNKLLSFMPMDTTGGSAPSSSSGSSTRNSSTSSGSSSTSAVKTLVVGETTDYPLVDPTPLTLLYPLLLSYSLRVSCHLISSRITCLLFLFHLSFSSFSSYPIT